MGKLFSTLIIFLAAGPIWAGESLNSLISEAAQSQCAHLVIEAHDQKLNSKLPTDYLFGNKKVHDYVSQQMNEIDVQLKSKADMKDENYNKLVKNILGATQVADPSFYPSCYKHYAGIYRLCHKMGGDALACVFKQKAIAAVNFKNITAQIYGKKDRTKIAYRK